MTQEQKELLLKDLCARLPYWVKVQDELGRINKLVIGNADLVRLYYNDFSTYSEEKLSLPYLFPLSSMTVEQWNNAPRGELTNFTFESLKCGCFTLASYTCENNLHELLEFINWLIKNHFDVNGLIPMGLAIDATGLNIY